VDAAFVGTMTPSRIDVMLDPDQVAHLKESLGYHMMSCFLGMTGISRKTSGMSKQ
jgi:hypothetical protein